MKLSTHQNTGGFCEWIEMKVQVLVFKQTHTSASVAMSSTAPTHDGFETCFRCNARATCRWQCRSCPQHYDAALVGPYALCRPCSRQPCPICGTDAFEADTISSLQTETDVISFVTDHDDLADRIQARLRGTSEWLSARELGRDLGFNHTRDVNQVLYMLQRRDVVRLLEEPGEVPRWQLRRDEDG